MTAPLYVWQDAVVALTEYFCGNDIGRSKDDPVYLHGVTEGRDQGAMRAKYSSCGDLPAAILERIGVREPWVNRESLGGWRVGKNISLLAYCPIAKAPAANWKVEPGDFLLVWNHPQGFDAHACVALELDAHGKLKTGNYGAGGMRAAAWPGANISGQSLKLIGGKWYYGPKQVQRVLRIEDYVKLSTAQPDFSGAALTGEALDALGARYE